MMRREQRGIGRIMALTQVALSRVGIDLTPDEFEQLVVETIEMLEPASGDINPLRSFSAGEVDALRQGGAAPSADHEARRSAITRGAAEFAAIVATGLSVADTARMLRVDESRIRQRLANRTLFGIKLRGAWVLPKFQFQGDDVVTGIEKVFPCLPSSIHPVAVRNWFVTPDPDLYIDDDETPLSPRDWLLSGGNPRILADAASWL